MNIRPFEKKIWLASPTMHGDEQNFVREAFDTNWVSTVGENLRELERGIAEYVGVNYSVALASGTSALHLALKLAGVKHGDKVLCSDMTFAATVNPVVYEKAEPVFIDSEYETWNMDPNALEKAFEKYPNTKVVDIAHLYGTPSKIDDLRAVCEQNDAIVVEDAAESLGVTYKGQETGTFGKYNAISFNGNKIITTSGGGMLLTDDKEAADKARKWSTQARDPFPWYEHTELGYNYRMSNILAGIGRGQLLHLDEHRVLKKAIYDRYREGLKGLPLSMNPHEDCAEPNYWLSCLLIDEGCSTTPDDIRLTLEKFNVESRPIWKPMHMQPFYKGCDFISVSEKPVNEDIFARGLCLPSDIKMTEEQQDIVMEIIRSCF